MPNSIGQLQQEFTAALRGGDETAARATVARAIADGCPAGEIYLSIFAPGMVAIGELWERNELSVAEEHLATAITDRLIGELSPLFGQAAATPPEPGAAPIGTAVIGCVEGERHALGARMLADMFRQRGWRVLYLGADVPAADWIELAARYHADLVALSTSLRMHLDAAQTLIARMRAALPEALILVGGGALADTPDLWRKLGADLYHPDTRTAVELATARLHGDD